MEREKYSVANLHPVMTRPTLYLAKAMLSHVEESAHGKFVVQPFEGFRHPARQAHLFAGGKVTKARPWQSSHQYGLAVDFTGLRVDEGGAIIPNSWNWDHVPKVLWDRLKREASVVGLDVPIDWDPGHVQHPLFNKVRMILTTGDDWNWL